MKAPELYKEIYETKENLSALTKEYWYLTSSIDSWFFWFNLLSLTIPLLILYFAIDRKRIFEISFYGYAVHLLWSKVDSVLALNNYLVHPHSLLYFLPFGINITAVTLPVFFMLLYQYCTNRRKSFYIWGIILSAAFAYGFGSYSLAVDLLRMSQGMNLHYLFLIDLIVIFTAYWGTKLFLLLKNHKKKTKSSSL